MVHSQNIAAFCLAQWGLYNSDMNGQIQNLAGKPESYLVGRIKHCYHQFDMVATIGCRASSDQ